MTFKFQSSVIYSAVLFFALPTVVFGFSGDDKVEPGDEVPKTLHGEVVRLVFSPKGPYEGVLLKNGEDVFQVVFPKEMSAEMAKAIKPGERLVVVGTASEPRGYHLVFEAQKLTPAGGAEIVIPVEAAKDELTTGAEIEAERIKEEKKEEEKKKQRELENASPQTTLSGTVKALNYAKHGEANGVILTDGNFIHLRPHGAQAFNVAVGQKISATGFAKDLPTGGKVIENPTQVNGKPMPEKPSHDEPKPTVEG